MNPVPRAITSARALAAVSGLGQHNVPGALRNVLARAGLWASLLIAVPPVAAAEGWSRGLADAFRPQAGAAPLAAPSAPTERGAATSPSATPGLRVVVWSPTRAVASIDGKLVRVGDSYQGLRVTHISPQGVLLQGEGGLRQALPANPGVIKRMRSSAPSSSIVTEPHAAAQAPGAGPRAQAARQKKTKGRTARVSRESP